MLGEFDVEGVEELLSRLEHYEQNHELPLMRGPDGRWWAGRFIGEISFERRQLTIAPRLGIDVVGAWLAHALNLTVVPKAATPAAGGPLIAQLVDRMWSAALADAARQGPPRFRRAERYEGLFVRGRLNVQETLRRRMAGQAGVVSGREARSLENPVSRVLVLADRTLRSLLGVPTPWRPDRADGRLKPDILIRGEDQRLITVIDAKYKRLLDRLDEPYGVARGDLYQLAAYLSGHPVIHGALAYPPHAEDRATAEIFGPWRTDSGQLVEFQRLPAEEQECVAAVRELARHAVAQAASRPPPTPRPESLLKFRTT